MIAKEDIDHEDIQFGFTIVDTNESADVDEDAHLYAMTDEQFEAHLAELAALKAGA